MGRPRGQQHSAIEGRGRRVRSLEALARGSRTVGSGSATSPGPYWPCYPQGKSRLDMLPIRGSFIYCISGRAATVEVIRFGGEPLALSVPFSLLYQKASSTLSDGPCHGELLLKINIGIREKHRSHFELNITCRRTSQLLLTVPRGQLYHGEQGRRADGFNGATCAN